MTTPTRSQIYEKALELWHKENMIHGTKTAINPTVEELKESGYYQTAQQILMCANPYKITIEKQSEPDKLEQLRQRDLIACKSQPKLISDGLFAEILKTGLIVASGKGHGKTNAVKVITSEILKRNVAKVKVFDSALNWIFDFSELKYQLISEDTQVYNVANCVYDLTFIDDPEQINRIIRQIVSIDFHNFARMKLLTYGNVSNWLVYVIEEAQNIIGSSALRSYRNRFWLKAISTGRNIGLSFVFVTQRLSDVSSKAVERCQGYLIGKMTGDNDLRKLRSIAGKELSWLVKDLQVGQFYYYNGRRKLIQFPLYNSKTTPQAYLQPQPTAKPSLWSKLLGRG